MHKILYITTYGGTMGFFKNIIKELICRGDKVDIATNEDGGNSPVPDVYRAINCSVISISNVRTPFSLQNIKAIKQIRNTVITGKYNIVHCHTPIAAACTRLACRRLRKEGIKVFYTAHGFHFYTGAPLANWILYYPVEWICSFFTDDLITINTEDYDRAQKKLHAKRTHYIPGVGVDPCKYAMKGDNSSIREEFSITKDTFLLLSVGELNDNKNHISVIRALQGINNVTYIIVGRGSNRDILEDEAKKNGVNLILAGYRNDVANFYQEADCYILPSHREGLNVSIMEAMGNGLPCLVSNIRGNRDLIDNNGGMLFDEKSLKSISMAINTVMGKNISDRKNMGEYNKKKVQTFEVSVINKQIMQLYDYSNTK